MVHAVCLCTTNHTNLLVCSLPASLRSEQAAAGQILVHTGLALEGAHGHRRPLSESELGLDQQAVCDWEPSGEGHSEKQGMGGCLACTCCCVERKRQRDLISQ